MYLEPGHTYHIYNRGNLSKKIFYTRENYLFFLRKIQQYISPYADILAWVLMPNHFHLMVYVRAVVIDVYEKQDIKSLTQSETLNNQLSRFRSLNDSIGIMLRTYTRAIQKQEKFNGSLFQEHSKANCLTKPVDINFSWFYKEYELQDNLMTEQADYLLTCFKYIHENPVKAGLCKSILDWEFSSAVDYFGQRGGKLVNRAFSKELGLI